MRLSASAHVDTFCRDNLPPRDQWPRFHFELPELQYPDRLNCAETLLDEAVARWGGERTCLVTPTAKWTYDDVRNHANQVASVLIEDAELKPGNRVLLRGPNNPWLLAAWFGVLKAGCVAVTTMPLLRSREISTLYDLTRPSLTICDHRFIDEVNAASPDVPVMTYGAQRETDLVRRCAGRTSNFSAVATAADDVALLAPTSGTTGKPKITMHFHRDVLASADTFARYVLKPREEDVFTGTPPIGFTYGLGGLVVFPLRFGAAVLMLESHTPKQLVSAIAEHAVTVLFAAPTVYKATLGTGNARALASLRRCVSAGEHLPKEVWEDFSRETGVKIIDGIGGTEMLHIFIAAADENIRPGATGKAVPRFDAAILDDAGVPVADGEAGRLAVRGPTGCRYLRDSRQSVYVQDGWNITGDTYRRDVDGYFWYQARSDDMIVSAGYNIAGPEVEEVLLSHPDVVEAAVVAAPDEKRGTIVQAYIVLRPDVTGDNGTVAELQAFVKRHLAPYKYPRAIEFAAELPRTATGKLQRNVLRERAASAVPNRTDGSVHAR